MKTFVAGCLLWLGLLGTILYEHRDSTVSSGWVETVALNSEYVDGTTYVYVYGGRWYKLAEGVNPPTRTCLSCRIHYTSQLSHLYRTCTKIEKVR